MNPRQPATNRGLTISLASSEGVLKALITCWTVHRDGGAVNHITCELEQVLDRDPGPDELLALVEMYVHRLQADRGRAVARPPIRSTRWLRRQPTGIPSGDHRGQ